MHHIMQAMSHHDTCYDITSYHSAPHQISSHYVMLHHTKLQHIILEHIKYKSSTSSLNTPHIISSHRILTPLLSSHLRVIVLRCTPSCVLTREADCVSVTSSISRSSYSRTTLPTSFSNSDKMFVFLFKLR